MKLRTKTVSVIIWSENHEQLAKWYEQTLGFAVKSVTTLPNDSCIDFEFNEGTYFSIGKHSQVHGNNRDPYRIMIGFQVESVSEAYKEIKDKNITWIAPPFEAPPGGYWCMTIADPEGNILQFFGDK